jgi:predicted peroxiredoxin
VARFLVQVAAGPENPTRAALGLLIARTAAEEGHDVTLFLAGDAVDFARPETAEAGQGIGTGSVAEHLAAAREAGATLVLSRLSSNARGITSELAGGAELVSPQKLVELAAGADTVLVY